MSVVVRDQNGRERLVAPSVWGTHGEFARGEMFGRAIDRCRKIMGDHPFYASTKVVCDVPYLG